MSNFADLIAPADRSILSAGQSGVISQMYRGECVPARGRPFWFELEKNWNAPTELTKRNMVTNVADLLAKKYMSSGGDRKTFFAFFTFFLTASVGGGVYSLAAPWVRACVPANHTPVVGTVYSIPRQNWFPATKSTNDAIADATRRGYVSNPSFMSTVLKGFTSAQFLMFAAGSALMVAAAAIAGASVVPATPVPGPTVPSVVPSLPNFSPLTIPPATPYSGVLSAAKNVATPLASTLGKVAGTATAVAGTAGVISSGVKSLSNAKNVSSAVRIPITPQKSAGKLDMPVIASVAAIAGAILYFRS